MIWQMHDKEDFDTLQPTARQLYISLGLQESAALRAAGLLTSAYRLADRAEMASTRKEERAIYQQAAEKLCEIRRLFGRAMLTGALEAMWWKAFRHKQESRGFLLLFASLFLAKPDPIFALRTTRFLHNAARLHSDRDWESVDVCLDQYWFEVSKKRCIPLVGGI